MVLTGRQRSAARLFVSFDVMIISPRTAAAK